MQSQKHAEELDKLKQDYNAQLEKLQLHIDDLERKNKVDR